MKTTLAPWGKLYLLEDARIKIKLGEMTTISDDTVHTILHDDLNLSKVCARWVSRILTGPQKHVRVDCNRESLELCGEDTSNILDRIVIGEET